MKRGIVMLSWACLALCVALGLGIPQPAWGKAIRLVSREPVAEPAPPSPVRPQVLGEGALRFEVEPGDVEIYLDEQYLGRAGELRGRLVEGILAGNRLLELRRGGERTFLQVVVPLNGTRTIRVNLEPPGTGG